MSEKEKEKEKEKEEDLDTIEEVLRRSIVQTHLVYLYSASQSECTRNGKCTMEIGTSRENDLKAVLREHIGDEFKTDINNNCVEDCQFKNEKISIKHISAAVGKGSIKAKWTSDTEQAKQYIVSMVSQKEKPVHMILVYIDIAKKAITIVCIAASTIKEIIQDLGQEAFSTATGTNNRGVEYSKRIVSELIRRNYFMIEIRDVAFTNGLDPIQRRRALLATI